MRLRIRHVLLALTASLALPATALRAAEPVRTVHVVTARGQPYYVGSYFLAKVAPPNIKFDMIDAPTSGEALDSLLTGSSDVAYMGLITSILAVARDRPIQVVASVGYKGTRIIARADSSIHGVADLAGKDVGVSKASNQDIILRELLANAGVDPAKGVNWILLPSNAHFEALASKTVDAVTTSEPYGSFMLLRGVGREIVQDPYTTAVSGLAIGLTFSRDTIAKDPAFVQQVVDLHARATVYAQQHPEEVLKVLVAQSRQPEQVMQMAYANAALQYDITDDYVTQAKALIGELVKAKYLDKPVDADRLFNLTFLPEARAAIATAKP